MVRATRVVAATERMEEPDEFVELDFEHRHRRRLTMRSRSGRQFLLDLPKATALADGDVLVLEDRSTIAVVAKPERVADIFGSELHHLVRIAWHLGNRHLPTQILPNSLRILYDHVIVEMVRGLGARVEEREAPFQPEGGAYVHAH